MKKNLVALTFVLTVLAATSHAAEVTKFGSSGFTIDTETTTFSANQTLTTLTFSGTDSTSSILAGTFSLFDATGLNYINLVGSISGTNPNSGFTVELFNSTFNETKLYSGTFGAFGASSTTVQLSFVSQTASFTTIAGFQLTAAGSGDPINMTLSSLNATASPVPEPGTTCLLALAVGSGIFLRLRRRG